MNKSIIEPRILSQLNNSHDYKEMRFAFGVAIMMKAQELRTDIDKVYITWENPKYDFYDSHSEINFYLKNGKNRRMNTNMNSLQATFEDMDRWLVKADES